MDQSTVMQAIQQSWNRETAAEPQNWTAQNPAKGHCDVSSFVAWEHLGGELVLGEVFIDGERSEYHYWNRIDGEDLDLTESQFSGIEDVQETSVLTTDFLLENRQAMRPELMARIDQFRSLVDANLAGS